MTFTLIAMIAKNIIIENILNDMKFLKINKIIQGGNKLKLNSPNKYRFIYIKYVYIQYMMISLSGKLCSMDFYIHVISTFFPRVSFTSCVILILLCFQNSPEVTLTLHSCNVYVWQIYFYLSILYILYISIYVHISASVS